MKHHSIFGVLILICCVAGFVMSIDAQDSVPTAAVPSPSVLLAPTPDSSFGKRLEGLEREVQKLKAPQKDGWDKLNAVSGLLSGLLSGSLVVLIGYLINYKLSERNRITAEQQKQRELAVAQVQTVQSFMPQLQAGGPKEVEAALLAISALDINSPLAINLASLYRNEGSISALRKIASASDGESARRAQQTLASMITVSLKQFNPNLENLNLSINALPTFRDLTNQVFWGLKGAVRAFKYEESWILKNRDTGEEFRKMRTDGEVTMIDTRSLAEVGIKSGMTLEAVPLKITQIPPPR